MNKRSLHHFWTKFRLIRPRYFLILALISGLICVAALRSNNEHMIQLRGDVYTADKDNGNVEQALENLRAYVVDHMNTALASGPDAVHPPIQLKYTYNRLMATEDAKVQAENKDVYTNAETYCQAEVPEGFSGRYRLGCVDSYVTSHGATVKAVPRNLYEFDFVDAKWSPDLAGWSMVVTILLLIAAASFWITDRLIKRQLKQHD
jgi:hypothetical protein